MLKYINGAQEIKGWSNPPPQTIKMFTVSFNNDSTFVQRGFNRATFGCWRLNNFTLTGWGVSDQPVIRLWSKTIKIII